MRSSVALAEMHPVLRPVDDMAGNDLTAADSVFNKIVKYGYAHPDLFGACRSDPPRDPGAARHGRGDGRRARPAVRHVVAGRVAASQGADRCRPDRAPRRGAMAALRAARRGLARRRRLDRGLSPLLGAAVRQARRVPEAHRACTRTRTQGETPWTPPLTIAHFVWSASS